MKSIDVTALGELLIDFTENGVSPQGNPLLEANPGGAPCNVLSMLSKLGHKTAFIGKVGADAFGRSLRDTITKVGIDDSGLIEDDKVHTTLAFVHTMADGDRDFSFYRNPGADMMLTPAEVKEELLLDCRIFHFGSLSMTAEECRKATEDSIEVAKHAGALISFDPNLRPPLWDNLYTAKERILYGLAHCDILKISDNEIEWLTGEMDYRKAVDRIKTKYEIPLVLVSLGKQGSMAFSDATYAEVPAYQVNTIETTGAGDTFGACVLHYILENGFRCYKKPELEAMLTFANAAAALVTTRKGALAVMPEKEEIAALVQRGIVV